MNTGQIVGLTVAVITIVFAIIASAIGGTWMLSEKINASNAELRVEIREENAKTRDELRKEIGELRNEVREENAKTRVEIEGLRGDIERLDSKFDEFKDSHEREHDLFYGQGDSENPAPPN